MRVSRAERQLINGLRNPDTRKLVIDVFQQHLDSLEDAESAMVDDSFLAQQGEDTFLEVFGQSMVDKAAIRNLLEDLRA